MDTPFPKYTSIIGNAPAQSFTYGEFVQISSIRSKSEARNTLDRIHRDVRGRK